MVAADLACKVSFPPVPVVVGVDGDDDLVGRKVNVVRVGVTRVRRPLRAAAAAGYWLGVFPAAAIAARGVSGGRVDLRSAGTGNPGAANALGCWGVAPASQSPVRISRSSPWRVAWFYERIAAGAHATTSQPNPAGFLMPTRKRRRRRRARSLRVSQRPRLGHRRIRANAARDAPLPVTVVDSGTTSFGVGICVLEAAQAGRRRSDGKRSGSAGHPADAADRERLRRGRRTRRTCSRGRLAARLLIRRRHRDTTRDHSLRRGRRRRHVRAHCPTRGPAGRRGRPSRPETRAHANPLADTLMRAGVEVMRYRVGPSVGTHTGPDSFGAFWWAAALAARGWASTHQDR